jgi:hypothetical protein
MIWTPWQILSGWLKWGLNKWACDIHRTDEKYAQGFSGKAWSKETA